jgi:hypothetical protein
MKHDALEQRGTPRRRSRHKHKRKDRKLERVLYNVWWFLGGLAIGLPLLGAIIYMASHY